MKAAQAAEGQGALKTQTMTRPELEQIKSEGGVKPLAQYTNEDLMVLTQPTHERMRGTFIIVDDLKITLDEPSTRAGWWKATIARGGKVRNVEVCVVEGDLVPMFSAVGSAKLCARQEVRATQTA
jgi:hypothetical protein